MLLEDGAIAQVELGKDPADVALHGHLGDDQLVGDLAVGQAAAHQPQHVDLARRQLVRRHARRGQAGALAIGGEDARGHGGIEQGLPGSHGVDGTHQVLGGGVLQQESRGAGPQRTGQQLVVVERRQHEHRGSVGPGAQPPGRLDAVDAAHAQVHHDDVRRQRRHRSGHLVAVAALADDLEAVLAAQDPAQAGADQLLVVDQQHTYVVHRVSVALEASDCRLLVDSPFAGIPSRHRRADGVWSSTSQP